MEDDIGAFEVEEEKEYFGRKPKKIGSKRIDWCGDLVDEVAKILGLNEKDIKNRHKEWKASLTRAQKERAATDYRTFKYRFVIRKLEEAGAKKVKRILSECLRRWLGEE